VQQIGNWSVKNAGVSGVVAFVYKDGPFPPDVLAADDPFRAIGAGARLADFERGLLPSYGCRGIKEIAIGHSWGLAAVTSSELVGARYDEVVSLAGAGMPPHWAPTEGTNYTHYSYTDFLTTAQPTGLVYGWKNPAYGWGFDKGGWYVSSGDRDRVTTLDPRVAWDVLVSNHSLVAQDTAENRRVLFDIKEDVLG